MGSWKSCLSCGARSALDATECECGHQFSDSVPTEMEPAPDISVPGLVGGTLCVLGVAAWITAFAYDPSIAGPEMFDSRIINLGRLQAQLMIFVGGCALFVSGVISFATGAVIRAIGAARAE